MRALPVADAASKKEWQRSKFEAAASAAHKFWIPQQGTFASAAGGGCSEQKGVAAVKI